MFEWSGEADQIDQWEEELVSCESQINRLRSRQAELVGKLDPHQIAWSYGDRNVTDWLSSTLDISHQTASRLRTLAYSNHSQIKAELAQSRDLPRSGGLVGGVGQDRALGDRGALPLPRLLAGKALPDAGAAEKDVLGRVPGPILRPLSGDPALLGPVGPQDLGAGGGTGGGDDRQALNQRETELPVLPEQTSGQRRIDALASICLDSLTGTNGEEAGGERRAVTVAEVFIDAQLAGRPGERRG